MPARVEKRGKKKREMGKRDKTENDRSRSKKVQKGKAKKLGFLRRCVKLKGPDAYLDRRKTRLSTYVRPAELK